ncbi:DUF5723 family protein [Pedobacter sp. AW31-3R]|uniref:DUF5723 family protein n=1 Tax=Pedobacter sp. AW31-3R TaxID=3445781 RepID=UPI003FA0F545
MAKRYFLLIFLLIAVTQLKAQQYGLFNTRTLFDAFENPAQRAFVLDSSRQYASNFLLPYFNIAAANKGDANSTLKRLLDGDGTFNTSGIPVGNQDRNTVIQNSNIYLLTFRIFKSYKYHKELGFSWQVRTDARADYTNETLVAFDDYNRLVGSAPGLFNGIGDVQTYHQFSINYRENYNKRLAFGAKLSLLSGVTYNRVEIGGSEIGENPFTGEVQIGLAALYRTNILDKEEVNSKLFMPTFKNPGLSVGLGTTYTSKSGFFMMGNIKDLGFIKWNKSTHSMYVNDVITLDNLNPDTQTELKDKLYRVLKDADQPESFYTATNAKAEFLISRKYGFYTPNFIVSKNLFYKGGDVVLVNNFKYNEFSVALSPTYNLNGFGMLGAQGMYQTPNFEFFMGTDNLLRTATLLKSSVQKNTAGASFYMGLGIKFGYTVEHPQNSSYMPGLENDKETSFFSKLFGIFKKK